MNTTHLSLYILFLDLTSKAQEYKLPVRHFYFAKEELLQRERRPDEIDSLKFPEKPLSLSNRHSIRLATLEEVPPITFCQIYVWLDACNKMPGLRQWSPISDTPALARTYNKIENLAQRGWTRVCWYSGNAELRIEKENASRP